MRSVPSPKPSVSHCAPHLDPEMNALLLCSMTRPELVLVVALHPQATLEMTKNRIAHNRKMWIHAPPKNIEVVSSCARRRLGILLHMLSRLTCLLPPIFTGQTGQYRHHGVPDPNLPRHLRVEARLCEAVRNRAMNHGHDKQATSTHMCISKNLKKQKRPWVPGGVHASRPERSPLLCAWVASNSPLHPLPRDLHGAANAQLRSVAVAFAELWFVTFARGAVGVCSCVDRQGFRGNTCVKFQGLLMGPRALPMRGHPTAHLLRGTFACTTVAVFAEPELQLMSHLPKRAPRAAALIV